ncbi:E3 ubiquitin-protein ligase RNF115 isoform X2 [Pygocentrus nattereri]|uniref:E3 ubiquitin-protein ligase RNF115 isoform X2 n=1 Tax=Pygocentrus nattereri TaxID=42514 RepID=UPI00081423DF|nr:E3 ubiquitin-protein ligase RNF115 isoform X2 [Pygocentrus nattereri]
MAEAAESPRHRFFCHCCKSEVEPKVPEYLCPRCESGFIEEVTEDSSVLQSGNVATDGVSSSDGMTSQFAELWQLLFMERSALLSDPTISGSESLSGTSAVQTVVADHPPETLRPVAGPEGPSEAIAPEQVPQQHSQRRHSRPDRGPAVEGIRIYKELFLFQNCSAILGWPVRQLWKYEFPAILLVWNVALKPRRLCLGTRRFRCCHYTVVGSVGERWSTACRERNDLIPPYRPRLIRTGCMSSGMSRVQRGVLGRGIGPTAALPALFSQ